MGRCGGVLAGVLAGAVMAVVAAAAAVAEVPAVGGLAGHRAIYRISLVSADHGSGIVGARGAMMYRFTDGCDGWTVENRIYQRFRYDMGEVVETTWTFVGWESKDGLDYRFRMRHVRDGVTIEKLQGKASLDRRGGAGVARFSVPAETTIDLPAGTMFPTGHLLALIEAARTGTRRLSRAVFDGTSLDNPYEVNALIGKEVSPGRRIRVDGADLAERPEWRVRMAFFPVSSINPEPEFEIELNYRDDGIADGIRQYFGDYVMDLDADAIEILSAPDC